MTTYRKLKWAVWILSGVVVLLLGAMGPAWYTAKVAEEKYSQLVKASRECATANYQLMETSQECATTKSHLQQGVLEAGAVIGEAVALGKACAFELDRCEAVGRRHGW